MNVSDIPNIDIGQVYDQHYKEEELHYERLENLASFFGRNMPVHHHDRFYQLHVVLSGPVHVHLDETLYKANGPMFFFTPPTVPHSFVIDNDANGHVLTIRQQLVWMLLGIDEGSEGGMPGVTEPFCVELQSGDAAAPARFLKLLELFASEFESEDELRLQALQALLKLVLIDAVRLADHGRLKEPRKKADVHIFHQFNTLIETRFREHWTLSRYAQEIGVTEARLNDICRRLSGLSSKRLVMDRLVQEARRQLIFTSASVSEIGYGLGFRDPAYFARFFRRHAGMTATEFRLEKQG